MALFIGGAVLTIIWSVIVIQLDLRPLARSRAGLAVMGAVMIAPGLGVAWFANRLARERKLSCRACGWSRTDTLRAGGQRVSNASFAASQAAQRSDSVIAPPLPLP